MGPSRDAISVYECIWRPGIPESGVPHHYLVLVSHFQLPQDHWVSRGYQQNFASADKRVAVFSVSAKCVIERDRPIKSNFREPGFTTFLEGRVPNPLLERAFASVERRVLNEIRTISAARQGPEQKADVANLFAVHLVRSPAFKSFYRHIGDRFRVNDVESFATDERLTERFKASEGRPPDDGELLDLALRSYAELVADPMSLVSTMIRHHDAMAERLNRFHLQIIELASGLPGLVIGDTPVVHARLKEDKYGFRDHLALGAGDLIIGPLTRATAACFTGRQLAPVLVTTRKVVDAINAIFIRAALEEVACHPDDAKALQQTYTRLDRLPPWLLTG